MTSKSMRILVVDDEEAIRHALSVALEARGYTVRTESTGKDLGEVVADFDPDLAVLDVRLPSGPDGYELARQLRSTKNTAILFLTAADSVRARLQGFEAGGDDYLVKPFSLEELLARVQALLRRAGALTPSVLQAADLVIDLNARTATRAGTLLDITRTEFDLLATLAKHDGQVLTKTKLLHLVWGFESYDTNLVEVHVSSLRRKLEGLGARLIHTVRGVGYVLRP